MTTVNVVSPSGEAIGTAELPDAIFAAKPGVVSGPVYVDVVNELLLPTSHDIQSVDGYYVFEVKRVIPKHLKPFAQFKKSLSEELPEQLRQQTIAAWVAPWRAKWEAKTSCSPGFVIAKCSEYKRLPTEPPEIPYGIS